MKRIAKIALLLVITMIGASLLSCASPIAETKVTLKITAGSDQIFSGEITVNNESPTVLQIVKEAEMLYPGSFTVTYDEDDTYVTAFNFYKYSIIDGVTYFWEYKLNGELPESGKASTNTVANGDTIEYVFDTSTPSGKNDNKFIYGTYDSASGLFTEDSGSADTSETTAAS